MGRPLLSETVHKWRYERGVAGYGIDFVSFNRWVRLVATPFPLKFGECESEFNRTRKVGSETGWSDLDICEGKATVSALI